MEPTDLLPAPLKAAAGAMSFIRRHMPAFVLLLPLMAAILLGMYLKGENKALRLQVQLEQSKTSSATTLADSRLDTIHSLEASAKLQHDIQGISDEAQARTASAAFWRDAAERLRRQSAQTGCLVPAQLAGVPAGAAEGDGLEDGAGGADRLARDFEEADRTTQKLIGLQSAWELMEKRGGCKAAQ